MNSPEEERTKQGEDVTQLIVPGNERHDSAQHGSAQHDSSQQNSHQQSLPRQAATKPGESLLGKTIGGHYELLSVLGTGGMSVVYKANHVLLNKTVAIKLLSPQRILDDDAVRRFQQEARAACHLGHQNIVVTRDFGLDAEGRPFLVMDFVSGKSLDKLIAEQAGSPLEPKQAVRIITQISAAIAYAHKQGVIHRDIKPANIIVSESPTGELTATLVDFGIAKIVTGEDGQNLTQTGEIFGSPLYMSPEQCLGKKVDSRSDVYSLGCVMYEMLTGVPPFIGDGPLATLMMHVNDKPLFESDKKSGELANRLISIVKRCLAKDPQHRYQTMEELGQDIERAATMSPKDWQNICKVEEPLESGQTGQKDSYLDGALADKVVKTKDTKQLWLAVAVVIGLILYASLSLHPTAKSGTGGERGESRESNDEGENWLNQGRVYYRDGNYASALSAYQKAEKYNPKLLWVHQNKAEAYQHLGEELKAAAELKAQLEQFPYHPGPLVNAAETWKEQNHLNEARLYRALAELDQRVKHYPDSPQAYEERAQCFDELGEPKLAALDREAKAKIHWPE